MKILIVDDEVVSRAKVSKLLSAYGECTEAEEGMMALCLFGFACGNANPFTLVTVDVEMPGLRGPDVVRAIRGWEAKMGNPYPGAKNAKIIMLTSHSDMTNIYDAYKEFCDDYIVKPISPDKIRDSLRKLGLTPPPAERS